MRAYPKATVRAFTVKEGEDVMQTCTGKTKTGAPCRAPAAANGLCFFHGNPDRAHLLGQIGGKKNRRAPVVDLEVPDNMNANGLLNLAGKAIRALMMGKLTPRKASALAQLSNVMHRMLPTADLENRLAKVEQQLEEQSSLTSAQTDPTRPSAKNQQRDGTDKQSADENTFGLGKCTPGESAPSREEGSS
jgi:hypothetical protein